MNVAQADDSLAEMLIVTGMSRLRALVLMHSAMRTCKGAGRVWHRLGMTGQVPDPYWGYAPIVKYKGTTLHCNGITVPQIMPETVSETCVGRPATDLIDHPAARGRTITSVRSGEKETVILMNPTPVKGGQNIMRVVASVAGTPLVAIDLLADKVAKARIRLRVRMGGDPGYQGPMTQAGNGFMMNVGHSCTTTPFGTTTVLDGVIISTMLMPAAMIMLILSRRDVGGAGVLAILASCVVMAAAAAWWRAFELTVDDGAYVMPSWRLRRWGPKTDS